MKKTRIFAVSAAAVCCATVLAACGGNGGGNNNQFVGHWNVKTMEAGGEELDVEALMNAVGGTDSNSVGMDIKGDGNFSLNIYGNDESRGTWKTSGNNSIVLTINGDDETATLEDGKLKLSYGEGNEMLSLYFEKGDSSAGAATEAQTESVSEETEAKN